MKFTINQHLIFSDGRRGLVCDSNERLGKMAYVDLIPWEEKGRKFPKPIIIELEVVRDLFTGQELQMGFYNFPDQILFPEDLFEGDKLIQVLEERDERYKLIKDIVENDYFKEAYLYGGCARSIILDTAKKFGCSEQHIYRTINRYFTLGSTLNALIPFHFNKGSNYNRPLLISVPGKPRGRKPIYGINRRNSTQEDYDQINQFITDHRKIIGHKTFKALYSIYDRAFHVRPNPSDEHSAMELLPPEECISEETFSRILKKLLPVIDLEKAKKGRTNFKKDIATISSTENSDVIGPGQRYTIDATVLNIYLLWPYSTKNNRYSSGRPVLYIVKDVFTTLIVGFYIGMDGPNWDGVCQALFNAFTDKVKFCKQFGIDIEPDEWPSMILCLELQIDNGVEYPLDPMQEALITSLGIQCVKLSRIHLGSDKGGVEREFRSIDENAIQGEPGFVPKIQDRGKAHSSNLATYALEDLKIKLINEIRALNRRPKDAAIHDKAAAKAGVDTSALGMWHYNFEAFLGDGLHRIRREEELLWALLPRGKAITCRKGLKFKGLFYHSDFAESEGWLIDRASRSVKSVDIRHAYSSVDILWFKHKGKVHSAFLSSRSVRFAGERFEVVQRQLIEEKIKKIRLKDEYREYEHNLKNETDRLLKERLENNKRAYSGRKSPQNTDEYRKLQAELQRLELDKEIMTLMSNVSETKVDKTIDPALTLNQKINNQN